MFLDRGKAQNIGTVRKSLLLISLLKCLLLHYYTYFEAISSVLNTNRVRADKIIQEDIRHRIDFNFAFELGTTSVFSRTEFYTEIDDSYFNALSWASW